MTGTHLVPPSFALPPAGTQPEYSPEVRGWLEDYEARFGPRGFSSMTTEQVPLSWTAGPIRVIDVRGLVGSTKESAWPASPVITPAHVEKYEESAGPLKPGDVVVFQTGHLDRYLKPLPEGSGVWADPCPGSPKAGRHRHRRPSRC